MHSRELLLARQREYSRRAYLKHRDARRATLQRAISYLTVDRVSHK